MMKFADIKKLLLILPVAAMFCLAGIGMAQAQTDTTDKSSDSSDSSENNFQSVKEYYASLEKIDYKTLSPQVDQIVTRVDKDAGKVFSSSDIASSLQKLTNAANGKAGGWTRDEKVWKNYKTTALGMGDSYIEDISEDLKRKLRKRVADGYMTKEEERAVLDLANRLITIGSDRAITAMQYDERLSQNEKRLARQERKIDKGTNATYEVLSPEKCPKIEILRAKYHSGCWSCLVVEKLTSAFMTAAEKAYGLSQKAGLVILGIGSVLWLLLWGLRNVSSLTQLEPGNILNELIKFGFKVALAYIFIILGLKMVGTYFINPMMGLGAKIAENYWDQEKIKPYTQEYDWELTDEQYKEIDQVGVTVNPKQEAEIKTQELSEADKAKLALAQQMSKNFTKTEIPNFIIPPVFEGALTSPTGCRFHPTKAKYANHKGLDIGTQGKIGGKIVASGPGKIYYAYQAAGAGNYAKIIHEKGWVSKYFHMLPQSAQLHKNGQEVAQGQVIGFVGTTGASTGPHLHFEITKDSRWVDPLYLLNGVIKYVDGACGPATVATFPQGFSSYQRVPTNPAGAWTAGGEGVIDLTSISTGISVPGSYSSLTNFSIGDIKYTGPTDIMSKAVMNSILGATKAIQDITSENMILGDAVMCYATLDNGGAWHPFGMVWTNFWMWVEGMFIWSTGLLLTVSIAYYLLDLSFKIGFAVIALPIVIGLWPFEITKDKISICISIIAKSAATFAFLAITTTYTVQLTDAVYSYEDVETQAESTTLGAQQTTSEQTPTAENDGPQGLAKLYQIFDNAAIADETGGTVNSEDINYAAAKLAVFSTTFVLLLFAFLYSYKLVQSTVPELVNKFFPDKAFGSSSPMHHWATAATKWAKDQAMKPVGMARDIALHQTGRLAKAAVAKPVGGMANLARKAFGKGDKKDGEDKGDKKDGEDKGNKKDGEDKKDGGGK